MEANIDNYFHREIKMLKWLGVSLVGNERMAYKIYSFVVLLAIVLMYPLLDTYELTKHKFDVVSKMISSQTATTMASVKVAILLLNRVKIMNLVEKMEKAPFAPNAERGGGDIEKKLIKQYMFITTVQTLAFWISMGIFAFCVEFYSLWKRLESSDYHDWLLPFGPITVLNITNSPNFEITWLYQNISVVVLCYCFTAADLLLCGFLAYICCQFKMLQNSIGLLIRSTNEVKVKSLESTRFTTTSADETSLDQLTVPWNYLNQSVKEVVNYHVQIADLAKEVDEVFSGSILISVLGTLFMLCFAVFTASVVDNKAVMMWNLGEGFCCVVPIFMICYWGHQVNQESQRVGRAAYESNFVGSDPRFQKSLTIIIRRSQNPSVITARKFAIISLSTFAWILERAYSSFMVLRSVNTSTE